MFLHDYLLACEISTVRTQTLIYGHYVCLFSVSSKDLALKDGKCNVVPADKKYKPQIIDPKGKTIFSYRL